MTFFDINLHIADDQDVMGAALCEMRAASRPFKLGMCYIYLGENQMWSDFGTITIEFPDQPWLKFTYTFSRQDILNDHRRLTKDFGHAWSEFFRSQQINPPEEFGLGEN